MQLPRRLSTWLVMLISAALFCLVQIPGRRTGFTTYSHGWPFAYLEREYRESSSFDRAAGYYYSPSGSPLFASDGSDQWIAIENGWRATGFPLELERLVTPWSFDNVIGFHLSQLFFVVVCGLMLVASVGRGVERRSKIRRWFQFRLRALLGLVTLIASACGLAATWRSGYESDQKIFRELGAKPPYSTFFFGGSSESFAWRPPVWLPEGAAKLPFLSTWFERVVGVRIENTVPSDFDRLSGFPYLTRLMLENNGADGRLLERVAPPLADCPL